MFTKGKNKSSWSKIDSGEVFRGAISGDKHRYDFYVAAMAQGILEVHTFAHLHSVQCFTFNNIKKRIIFKHLPLHCHKCGLFSQLKNINSMHYLERCKHFFLGLVQALKSDKIIYTYETQQAEVFY